MQPLRAKDASAPPDQFSAGRAAEILADLLGEEAPHPVGAAKNLAVDEAIIAKMNALGYQVEEQDATACRGYGPDAATCAQVNNLIAQLPGQNAGPAVLYLAHYDSVGAGPGAADDLSSVAAIIEDARIMQAHGPYRNPVIFLFSDAEEIGSDRSAGFCRPAPPGQEYRRGHQPGSTRQPRPKPAIRDQR